MLIGTNYQAVRWPAMGEDEGHEEGSEPASGEDSNSDNTQAEEEEEEEHILRKRELKGKKRARESDEDGEEGTIMPFRKKQDLIDPTFVALVTPHVSNADLYNEDNLCHKRVNSRMILDCTG